MPSPLTVKIKCQPYIKKFLIAKSLNHQEPIIFDPLDDYGGLLTTLLTNYNKLLYLSLQDKESVFTYWNRRWPSGHYLEIQIPYSMRKNVRFANFLNQVNQQTFITEVNHDFYRELNRFFKHNLDRGYSRREVLFYFLDLYNITEEDIKFDSLYRQSSRMLACKSPKFYKIFSHKSEQFVL